MLRITRLGEQFLAESDGCGLISLDAEVDQVKRRELGSRAIGTNVDVERLAELQRQHIAHYHNLVIVILDRMLFNLNVQLSQPCKILFRNLSFALNLLHV
jgi:hypothetical protein